MMMWMALVVALDVAEPRPLTLQQAMELATQNDPAVEGASIDRERARLRLLRTQLERIRASVDLNARALYVSPPFIGGSQQSPYGAVLGLGTLQASLESPLFSGWRVESNIEAAEQLEAATTLDIATEKRRVELATARAFWGVHRLDQVLAAMQTSEARLIDSERVVKARIAAGVAAAVDENRAASRRIQLDVERQSWLAQQREALVQLALVLGVDEPIVLVAPPPINPIVADLPTLIDEAIASRPELAAARLRGEALLKEQTAAESGYWPQLDAVALVQLGNNPSLPGADARGVSSGVLIDGDVQAGLLLRWNFFDTWATTHSVDDIRHRQRLAAAEQRLAARNISNTVRLAHARVSSLQEQLAGLARAQGIEADSLSILDKAWGRGEVLFTEVLDAQVQLATTERQIVDVNAQLALAVIELICSSPCGDEWQAAVGAP